MVANKRQIPLFEKSEDRPIIRKGNLMNEDRIMVIDREKRKLAGGYVAHRYSGTWVIFYGEETRKPVHEFSELREAVAWAKATVPGYHLTKEELGLVKRAVAYMGLPWRAEAARPVTARKMASLVKDNGVELGCELWRIYLLEA